jgi:transcriptional regulator with XRE-family HTH domain
MTTKRPDNIYGRRLREARGSYGFSQTDVGVAVGLDEAGASSRVSRYENGIHQPKLGMQQLFAQALELPLAYFYIEDDGVARPMLDAARTNKPEQLRARVRNRRKR